MIIYKQAMKRILKNKLRLLIIIIMPIIFIKIFATINRASIIIAVVDRDNSFLSGNLADSLHNLYGAAVKRCNEDAAYDKIISGEADYSIIIEPGFESKLVSGNDPELKEFYISDNGNIPLARAFIENYENNMRLMAEGSKHDKATFQKVLNIYMENRLGVTNETGAAEKINMSRRGLGFIVFFLIFTSVATTGLILEDRNSGVFFRTFYAPVSLKRYLLENLAAFFSVAVIQITLVIIAIKLLFKLEIGNSPLNTYLLLVLFSLVCIPFGMFIISIFKKPIHAYIAAILIADPLAMLGGCWWSQDMVPAAMRKIGLFMPTTWIMRGIDKFLYENGNIQDVLLEIIVLMIFSCIFFSAGLFSRVDISK